MIKYNLVVGAMFKNEADNLEEWLKHYLNRGVDHFYLINDRSEDHFLEVLRPYQKYITIYKSTERGYAHQTNNYNFHFQSLRSESKWCFICDIDEYLWAPGTLSICSVLDLFNSANVEAFVVQAVLFGSNNHIHQPKSIVKSFTKRQIFPFIRDIDGESCVILNEAKTLCQSSLVKSFSLHQHHYSHKIKQIINNIGKNIGYGSGVLFSTEAHPELKLNAKPSAILKLNHYRLQSKERWEKRLSLLDAEGNTNMSTSETNSHVRTGVDKYGLRYYKSSPTSISPNMPIDYEFQRCDTNYRDKKIFEIGNMCQNDIEDLGLVDQNIKFNINYTK